MDLAAGDAMHGLDGVTDGDDVIGQCAFHAPAIRSGLPKSMTHGSMPARCRMPTAPPSWVTSHMSAAIIIGCTMSTTGPASSVPAPGAK